jgi:hypothetical protein
MLDPDYIGRYRVIRLLKRGGMGILYLCEDPELPRLVVVKVLRTDMDPAELLERFEREIAAVGRLRHRNIVTIHRREMHEGRPALVMEYIPGRTLGEIVGDGAAMSLSRKLQIADEMIAAIGYAHDAGIIHRDIKPANVMVDTDGTVKVLDFGIAHIGESDLTHVGALLGTVNYMSPEQVRGERVDRRSDIFALGAVLYELFAYRQAFPGLASDGVMARILSEEPAPLRDLCPSLPDTLPPIVERAMRKEAARRYQDVAALREALASIADAVVPTRVIRRGVMPELSHDGTRRDGLAADSCSGDAVSTLEREPSEPLVRAGDVITTGEFARAMDDRHARVTSKRRQTVATISGACAVTAAAGLLWLTYSPSSVEPLTKQPAPIEARHVADAFAATPPGLLSLVAEPPVALDAQHASPQTIEPVSTAPIPQSVPPEVPAPVNVPAPVPLAVAPVTTPEPHTSAVGPEPVAPQETVRTATAEVMPPAPATEEPPAVASAAATTTAGERAAIVRLLDRYAAAMTDRNLALVRGLRRLPPEQLAQLTDELRRIRSWRVAFVNPVIVVERGQRAQVSVDMTYQDLDIEGRQGRRAPDHIDLEIEKLNGMWTIVDLRKRK